MFDFVSQLSDPYCALTVLLYRLWVSLLQKSRGGELIDGCGGAS